MREDVSYDEYMSDKNSAERATFGPTPRKKVPRWYETKWRTTPAIQAKVAALAKVGEYEHEEETGVQGTISVNAQVNFALAAFLKTVETQFGILPAPTDDSALKKYARKKRELNLDVCPTCGQKLKKQPA